MVLPDFQEMYVLGHFPANQGERCCCTFVQTMAAERAGEVNVSVGGVAVRDRAAFVRAMTALRAVRTSAALRVDLLAPLDASDPRIWDQDEDGNPGVTVNVSGFATGDISL